MPSEQSRLARIESANENYTAPWTSIEQYPAENWLLPKPLVLEITDVFSYNFLVNEYATSFKVKIQFDHIRSENNSAKLPLKYFEFSEK